jgi:hypothetical protein
MRSSAGDSMGALLRACAAFGVAGCVYAFVRPVAPALWPSWLHFPVLAFPSLQALTGSVPVFAHVLAMSWLSVSVIGARSRTAAVMGPVWAAVNITFEVGQHPNVAPLLASSLQRFEGVWPVERLGEFFTRGSFDVVDIVAAVASGFIATHWINRWREQAHVAT